MKVFWKHGYEGASLPALTAAMGINRPSMYAAFGNKQSLFLKALDRYLERPASFLQEALQMPRARDVAERLLVRAVESYCSPRNPRGCLLIQAALACSHDSEPIRRQLVSRRHSIEICLRQRFEHAAAVHDIPPDADPHDLARFVASLMAGLAVQAASGARRSDLEKVVVLAMESWPAPNQKRVVARPRLA